MTKTINEPMDVAIIGGSFAGNSAALTLARARRRFVVFDTGQPRNRFAAEGHGLIGMDGVAPMEIQARAQADVRPYASGSYRRDAVTSVARTGEGFVITTETGHRQMARRVILAHGNRDLLPEVAGLDACWGVTAQQCPYCHGVELSDLPTGLLWSGAHSLHQAQMLLEWTPDLTVLDPDGLMSVQERDRCLSRGIKVETRGLRALHHQKGHIKGIALEDGVIVPLKALYLASRTAFSAPFAQDLGCDITVGPMGPVITVDDHHCTSVPHVYAIGDICRPMYNAVFATADGVRAGTHVHRSLIEEEHGPFGLAS